ncbi:SPFH domain-containing protein [Thermoflexus sp.]|uniref:SPFH domain-containing protein n=1 Tax=Thermoflexus sp. TaxID=1969742 RepID=UPI002ADDB6AA|nr:SPFH domain-containing protein [Thermoflexus sp.]
MPRIFDVIEWADDTGREIVKRFPEEGAGDFRLGSQLIVRESQVAVFFRDGKALDVFGPGRHTLTTANIPLLINLLGPFFGGRSPFTAEVYFVSTREFVDLKWGTPEPIVVRNPGMGLGVVLLQGHGTFAIQVRDPQLFVNKIVGIQHLYETERIVDYLRSILVSKLADGVGNFNRPVVDLAGFFEELGAAVRAKAQEDFQALGLDLKAFYVQSLRPSSKTIEELRAMGLLDVQTYAQLQAADALREAAQQELGGLAAAGVGAGAGFGLAQFFTQLFQGMTARPAAPTAAPEVMTVEEAAAYLKVSPDDVVQLIESGQLKARKIGATYRISRSAIEEFLKG